MRSFNPQALDLFTSDVKMQMHMLRKKLNFIRENGGMTEEIERLTRDLSMPSNSANLHEEEALDSLPAKSAHTRLLTKAKFMKADSSYTGANLQHLLVRSGDLISVYAYVNEEIAVGFNTRTGFGGQFPVKIASEVEPERPTEPQILICRSSIRYGTGSRHLPYEVGHYVSVCSWEADKTWGYGFNHQTLTMGIFNVKAFDQIKWK